MWPYPRLRPTVLQQTGGIGFLTCAHIWASTEMYTEHWHTQVYANVESEWPKKPHWFSPCNQYNYKLHYKYNYKGLQIRIPTF